MFILVKSLVKPRDSLGRLYAVVTTAFNLVFFPSRQIRLHVHPLLSFPNPNSYNLAIVSYGPGSNLCPIVIGYTPISTNYRKDLYFPASPSSSQGGVIL